MQWFPYLRFFLPISPKPLNTTPAPIPQRCPAQEVIQESSTSWGNGPSMDPYVLSVVVVGWQFGWYLLLCIFGSRQKNISFRKMMLHMWFFGWGEILIKFGGVCNWQCYKRFKNHIVGSLFRCNISIQWFLISSMACGMLPHDPWRQPLEKKWPEAKKVCKAKLCSEQVMFVPTCARHVCWNVFVVGRGTFFIKRTVFVVGSLLIGLGIDSDWWMLIHDMDFIDLVGSNGRKLGGGTSWRRNHRTTNKKASLWWSEGMANLTLRSFLW